MNGYENSKIPRLFETMEKKNIKAKELARATGISAGSITDWKNGKSMPTGPRLAAVAEYLGVSIDYLLEIDEIDFEKIAKDNIIKLESHKVVEQIIINDDKAESERIIKSISDTLSKMSCDDLNKVNQIVNIIKSE